MSPPASPAAPAKSAYASTPPGAGPPRYPKDGNDFGPPSPEQQLTRHPTRGPHRPWKARPRATPADLPYPSGTINPTRRPARTTSDPNRSREKWRLTPDYFGENNNASNYGLVYSSKLVGSIVGIGVGASVIDAWGYTGAYWIAAASALVSAGIATFLRQPGRSRVPTTE